MPDMALHPCAHVGRLERAFLPGAGPEARGSPGAEEGQRRWAAGGRRGELSVVLPTALPRCAPPRHAPNPPRPAPASPEPTPTAPARPRPAPARPRSAPARPQPAPNPPWPAPPGGGHWNPDVAVQNLLLRRGLFNYFYGGGAGGLGGEREKRKKKKRKAV